MINPKKDVDGFHPVNVGLLNIGNPKIIPCTPKSCLRLIQKSTIKIEGSNIFIIGRSNIVGKPMANLLVKHNATITICHTKTNKLPYLTKQGQIIISAIGKAFFLNNQYTNKKSIIIDVGINRVHNAIVGDTNFTLINNKIKAITPVPGGVGPMTIAMLLENIYLIFKKKFLK